MNYDALAIVYESVGAFTPHYQEDPHETDGSAGFDLRADIEGSTTIQPGERKLISTGLRFKIPHGHEMQIRPRSGLALKHGVTVLNTPGTIDSDYRGVVGVILINHGSDPFVVRHGDRIAQAILTRHERVKLLPGYIYDDTERGSGGFGSTGVT